MTRESIPPRFIASVHNAIYNSAQSTTPVSPFPRHDVGIQVNSDQDMQMQPKPPKLCASFEHNHCSRGAEMMEDSLGREQPVNDNKSVQPSAMLEGIQDASEMPIHPIAQAEPTIYPIQHLSSADVKSELQDGHEEHINFTGLDQSGLSQAKNESPHTLPSIINGSSAETLEARNNETLSPHHSTSDSRTHSFRDEAMPKDEHPALDQLDMVKRESAARIHESIPAFIPVANIKREPSESMAQAREEQIPLPTTELLPSDARGSKRPAPKNKKGVAKKGPPPKKQKKVPSGAKPRTKSKLTSSMSTHSTPQASSPAPYSIREASSTGRSSPSAEANEHSDVEEQGVDDDEDGDEQYCICRKGDSGTFMIGCDGQCDDWFHGKCVGIAEKDKNLIDRYICPNCTKAGVGVTTWKRMCRRPGCRMPARLAKKDEAPSKYCSELCGVQFFRDQVSKTRGPPEPSQTGRRGRKHEDSQPPTDSSARGGMISKSELKSMLITVPTIDEFKRLGEGVLSPPATPSPTTSKSLAGYRMDPIEEMRVAEIRSIKDELRARHGLLKDQAKFVTMLRHSSAQSAEKKGLKPKDICGYDDRVCMSESAFSQWRSSEIGRSALDSGTLPVADANQSMENGELNGAVFDICVRKRCQKHLDWSKLALETNRGEMSENSERMRSLEREERDIIERAGLRARQMLGGDVYGTVELHDVHDAIERPGDDTVVPNGSMKAELVSLPMVPMPNDTLANSVNASDIMDIAA